MRYDEFAEKFLLASGAKSLPEPANNRSSPQAETDPYLNLAFVSMRIFQEMVQHNMQIMAMAPTATAELSRQLSEGIRDTYSLNFSWPKFRDHFQSLDGFFDALKHPGVHEIARARPYEKIGETICNFNDYLCCFLKVEEEGGFTIFNTDAAGNGHAITFERVNEKGSFCRLSSVEEVRGFEAIGIPVDFSNFDDVRTYFSSLMTHIEDLQMRQDLQGLNARRFSSPGTTGQVIELARH